jgi:DNA-binding GntR family transcriptional regulator
VISGSYGGDLLREEEVAADLGLSRTPVREAIQVLVSEGLLLKEHSRSARVFRPSLDDLAEIYAIRTPLEGLAARSAAELGGPALAKELAQLLAELANAEPGLSYSLHHEAFHVRLVEARSSPRLASIIRTLRAQSEPYVRFALQASADFLEHAKRDHRQIVKAIRARDGDLAEKLVSEHLRGSMERIPRIMSLEPAVHPLATHPAPSSVTSSARRRQK